MSHEGSHITVASCVQKLRDAKATDASVNQLLLEWLAEYSPTNSSDALQIVEGLTVSLL
eukprot:c1148_g1_i1 orf=106-282(+)